MFHWVRLHILRWKWISCMLILVCTAITALSCRQCSEGWVGAPNIWGFPISVCDSDQAVLPRIAKITFEFLTFWSQCSEGWVGTPNISYLRLWFRSSCPCPYCRNCLFNPCNVSNQMFDTEQLQSVRENFWGFLFHLFEGTFCLESMVSISYKS